MSGVLNLRASALPRAMLCPASVRGELRIDVTDDAGTLGTAVHRALASYVASGVPDWTGTESLDAEALRFLYSRGVVAWEQLRLPGSVARVEVSLGPTNVHGCWLSGHADVLNGALPECVRVLDWKSGRKDADYRWQMLAYCVLLLLGKPELNEVEAFIVWLRTDEIERYALTRKQLPGILEELRPVVEWDGVYHPGEHCHYCPRAHECQAAHALARRDILAISDQQLVARVESELALMPTETIVQLKLQADRVEKCAKRVKDAIKDHVERAGGRVEGDTLVLQIEGSNVRELDTIKAWPVLEGAGFQNEDFAECVTIGVTAVEKTIAAKAGKGNGAGAVRELRRQLEAVGAFEAKEKRTLVAKRR